MTTEYRWSTYPHIYNDGSKSDYGVRASSNYIPQFFYRDDVSISDHISVMAAGLVAIL